MDFYLISMFGKYNHPQAPSVLCSALGLRNAFVCWKNRSISELLDSCRHVLAASLPPDLQPLVSELHATDLGGIAAVISAERTARCARVEMLFLAQVGRGCWPAAPSLPHISCWCTWQHSEPSLMLVWNVASLLPMVALRTKADFT